MGKNALQCPVCERDTIPAMIACPHRESGGCPFTLEEGAAQPSCMGTFLMVFSLPFLAMPIIGFAQEPCLLPFMAIFFLAGLGLFLFGLYILMAYTINLTNPQDGTGWRGVKLLTWIVQQEMVTNFTPVALGLPPLPPLRYPASVASLRSSTKRQERAAFIFNSTLLALIAQGTLSLHYATEYRTRWSRSWQQVTGSKAYRVRLESGDWPVLGELESLLVQSIQQAGMSGKNVYQIVYDLYDTDISSPFGRFMGWVQDDAVQYGLGQSKSFGRFELTDPQAIDGDYTALRALHQAVNAQHPGLLESFGKEVQRAFAVRTESSD